MNEKVKDELDILLEAPGDASPEALAAYLDEACGSDDELRRKAEEILAADLDESDPRLRNNPLEKIITTDGLVSREEELPGAIIGNYRLIKEIGKGGFGLVFEAEQREPVRRTVALKLIKLGMDTRQVVARFEMERQALALMDHPNIARVFDAGASDSGRPYFVMELVRGVSITRFCEDGNLDLRERLRLFLEVLGAVQHAHQKGIVHRDLKPSNVLVTRYDSGPTAKVIDFGVAKATQSELSDGTLITRAEQMIGTPAYMSPEQAKAGGVDVDTRSDIYSLGVLLYELLCGSAPFGEDDWKDQGPDEIRRLIREVDPVAPSERLATARKNSKGRDSVGSIDKDLDWVVMKALEKERSRRYETASAFADDLRRYLHGEVVEAGGPDHFYRLRKFAGRNRKALVFSGAVAVLLVVGTVVSAFLAIEAREARDQARAVEQDAVGARDEVRLLFAEEQLASGKTEVGLAHLARLIRERSSNHRLAAERLMSVVRQRAFDEELFEFEIYGTDSADLSRKGDCLLVGRADGSAEVLNAATGIAHPEGRPLQANLGIPVSIARLSPKGDLALLGSLIPGDRKSTIHLWDWRSGALKWEALSFNGGLQSVEFSPDGSHFFLVVDGRASVRNVESGREVFNEPVQVGGSKGRYDPSGRSIVFSGKGQLIDAGSGKEIRRFSHGEATIFSARFGPGGDRVVTASADGTARIWRVKSEEYLVLLGHLDHVMDACFNPDGSLVATASLDGKARLWESATGRLIQEFDHGTEKVLKAIFSSDGRSLVTETWSEVRTWNLQVDSPGSTSYGEMSPRNEVRLSDDPELLMISEAFGLGSLWKRRSPQPASQVLRHQRSTGASPIGDFVWKASFSPKSDRIISAGADPSVCVWDAGTSKKLREFESIGVKWHVGFSPDESELVIAKRGTRNGVKLEIRDASSGEIRCGIPIEGMPNYVAYSPTRDEAGDYLIAVAPMGTNFAYLFNSRTGQAVGKPLPHGGSGSRSIHALCDMRIMFCPKGERVVTGTDDGSARVFSVPSGDLLLELKGVDGHYQLLQSVRFSPDGNKVITASDDGTARVWSVSGEDAGEVVHLLRHGEEAVVYAEFGPDGQRIVTASLDGTARVWDAVSGEAIGMTVVHRNAIRMARFSPDGRRFVTASLDGTARIWDTESGHALSDPMRHDGHVLWAEFDASGRRVVTSGTDATAKVWDVPGLPSGEVPLWLADWADAFSGWRADEQDKMSKVPADERASINGRILGLSDGGDYSKAVEWFYADRATRSITPYSGITVPRWVENRIEENSFASLREALLVSPGNWDALIAMVKLKTENPVGESETFFIRVRPQLLRGMMIFPERSDLKKLLAEVDQRLREARPAR